MNDLVQANANLPSLFGGVDDNDDLSAGVSGGFSVISFRGAKWRIKHGGEETLLTNSDGDPMPSIRVVMLKANRHISKNFYEGKYVEGTTDNPTCWSTDGISPDAGVENPVNSTCATCPNNQFGSRITDSGSKAKACGDSRRVAVVPENDLENEQYGGPMLLRVPAASLSELASFGKAMKAKGYPYNTIVTRLSFDTDVSYPRIKFNAVRPINTDERDQLGGLLQDERYTQKIEFVLAQALEIAAAAPAAAPAAEQPAAADPTEFEEPPKAAAKAAAKAAPKAASKPTLVKAAEAKKAQASPVQAPEKEPAEKTDETGMDSELDDILAKLDSLE